MNIFKKARYNAVQMLAPAPNIGGLKIPGLVVYGDSIMHGALHSPDVPYTEPTLFNRAVPGDTAQECAIRFPYETRSHSVVVIQCGTNDLSIKDDPVDYVEDMVKHAIEEGRRVVLTGITLRKDAAQDWLDVNASIIAIAANYNCQHLGWNTIHLNTPDGLHPDDQGYSVLAKTLGGIKL